MITEKINHQNNMHGIWWFSGSTKEVSGVFYPNEKILVVNGDLRSEKDLPIHTRIDENGKITKIMGFGSGNQRIEEDHNQVIYGLCNNKEITLFYESDPTGRMSLGSGFLYDESKWGITRYIFGKHTQIEEIFHKAIFDIENLNTLINKNTLIGSYEFPPKDKLEGKFLIKKEEEELFKYNGIIGVIQYSRNASFDGKILVEPKYALKIISDGGFTLSEINGLIPVLANLFLLLCEQHIIIKDINIIYQQKYNHKGETKQYSDKLQYIILNNSFINNESLKLFPGIENKQTTLYSKNIKNNDISNGIQNFFNNFNEISDPLSYYLASISNSLYSINTIFLNLVFGLEGFHRIVFGTKAAAQNEITETLGKIKDFISSLKLKEDTNILFNNSLSGARYGELSAKNKLREIKKNLGINDSIITDTEIIKCINQRDKLVHLDKKTLTDLDSKQLFELCEKLYKFFKYSILSHIGFYRPEDLEPTKHPTNSVHLNQKSPTLPNNSDILLPAQD